MSDKRQSHHRGHNILLENREKLSITGVEHVHNYNSEQIVLDSVAGIITIKGRELDIKKLNLEDGNISIDGNIDSLIYSEHHNLSTKSSNILSKIFK